LGRAVKPNRLLLPALVPAVNAGVRVVRAGRASGRVSLREPLLGREEALLGLPAALTAGLEPLVWPLRWLHAAVAGFAGRAPGAPLAGREAGREEVPLVRAPLLAPFVCAPLCLPLPVPVAAFGLQRAPLAFAGRAAESELVRRAERALGRLFAEDCAGFRSRECTAERLKWGRVAAGLVSEADLRAAGVRGAWGSGDLRASGTDIETGAADFGASYCCKSSS